VDEVVATLIDIVAEGRIPSASIVVRVRGVETLAFAVGDARLDPRRPTTIDTPYDLASVTKPLVASTVAAVLVQRGAVSLDDPAVRFVPRVDARVTVRHLLQHVSGLPAWAPLYERVSPWGTREARDAVIAAAIATPLTADPGTTHVYSDLGFLVLLAVLEAAGGDRIDVLHRDLVLVPAGFSGALRWGWPGAAATEDCPVRGRVIEGEVHDLNAWSMGGVSSHAGLFGTARSVAGLGEALLDAVQGRRDDLPGRALATFWASRGLGSHVCGWDTPSNPVSSTGRWWPAHAVGHLGYTGTSVWMAPDERVVVALLTNRVHPVDDKEPIRAARPRVHDAVSHTLGWDRIQAGRS
jgi:CubicO group peptidase (beta-lactamase class C family)